MQNEAPPSSITVNIVLFKLNLPYHLPLVIKLVDESMLPALME